MDFKAINFVRLSMIVYLCGFYGIMFVIPVLLNPEKNLLDFQRFFMQVGLTIALCFMFAIVIKQIKSSSN